jgi:preprotein translocase subunit SecA
MSDRIDFPPALALPRGPVAAGSAHEHLPIDHPVTWASTRLSLALRFWRERRVMGQARAADQMRSTVQALSDAALQERIRMLSIALRRRGLKSDLVCDGLAVVREVSRRTLGIEPYREQLAAAAAIMAGHVIEMATGEGKTLVAATSAALHGLAGRSVHVVTSNDYLAERDGEYAVPLLGGLGLGCGIIVHERTPEERRAAYRADVTYVSNKEVAFDYLRDRLLRASPTEQPMVSRFQRAIAKSEVGQPIQRGLDVAVVDEIDSVLIDEAGTPLLISAEGPALITQDIAEIAWAMAGELREGAHYERSRHGISVEITDAGRRYLETRLSDKGLPWLIAIRREELVRAALTARFMLLRDRHYILKDGKVVIVDENTGRTMADRFWGHDLHPMVEFKEGLALSTSRQSLASISFQRFFRRYRMLSGMSGTVAEAASELGSVYRLPITGIPRRRPLQRKPLGTKIFSDRKSLWNHVAGVVGELAARGQPVLVGVTSVKEAVRASEALGARGIEHRVLSAAQDREEAEAIAVAGERGAVTVATNMAGRGTDIRLGPGVAEAGGLVVLMCEMNDSRRADRQLIGRCGRQGDPGAFAVYISREDRVLSVSPSPWPSLSILPFIAPLAFRQGQKRIEKAQRDARRSLVRQDENLSRMLTFAGGLD